MSALLLVRHGTTPWNAEQRLQGDTDIDLSDQGRAQVAALAPLVAAYRPHLVVCSPLARTVTTAGLLGVRVDRFDPRWQEADLGPWNGRHVHDLPTDSYTAWRAGVLDPPGGETLPALRRRVTAALADLPGDRTVLVVTHGGPIRSALQHTTGLAPRHIVPVAPGSLSILDREGGGVRLRAYNLTPA